MKKLAILLMFASISVITSSCGGKGSGGGTTVVTPPLSERIKKSWSANIVKENSTVVYTKGGTTNTRPGYSAWKLSLLSPPNATYTEFDGNTFSGQYELVGESKLVLKALTPAPTGSGGTIEFTINSISDTQLVITRISASPKTGNSTNEYTLTSL